jgi:predicted nucleotidyltransferase
MQQPIAAHHERAIEKTISHYGADPHVLAVVLGGTLARGTQKESSDVDVMVILDEPGYEHHRQQNRLAECLGHLCDYPGGYVDTKFFPVDYLTSAAERGSEPTRNSFLGARAIFTRDPGIEPVLVQIGRYPEHERDDKILSFFAMLSLSSGYFWGEANKCNAAYLKTRTVSDIVLFACRLILAHNRVLFPSHKRMLEALDTAAEKPADMRLRIDAFLQSPTDDTLKALVEPVKSFRDWTAGKDFSAIVSRFVEDNEQWWWNHRPNIAEW